MITLHSSLCDQSLENSEEDEMADHVVREKLTGRISLGTKDTVHVQKTGEIESGNECIKSYGSQNFIQVDGSISASSTRHAAIEVGEYSHVYVSGSAVRPVKFKADVFVKGTKAQDAEDRIVYDRTSGNLYYDKDGTGSTAQVKIATLSHKANLKYDDFFVI
jgi:hypothetical protein